MQLRADSDGKVIVSGDLTLDSVTAVYREAASVISATTETVDLSAVERVDSAGLALLLEWQSVARRTGAGLSFENAPDDLLRLAALTEASALLGFKPGAAVGEPA